MSSLGLHLHLTLTALCRVDLTLRFYQYFSKNKDQYIHHRHDPLYVTVDFPCCFLPIRSSNLLSHFSQKTSLQTWFFPRMDCGGYKIHKQVDVSRPPIWHLESPSILPEPNLTTPFPCTGRVFLPRSDQIQLSAEPQTPPILPILRLLVSSCSIQCLDQSRSHFKGFLFSWCLFESSSWKYK